VKTLEEQVEELRRALDFACAETRYTPEDYLRIARADIVLEELTKERK